MEDVKGTKWLSEDDSALRSMVGRASTATIAEFMGRSIHAVQKRALRLKMSLAFIAPKFVRWTEAEDAVLRELAGKVPIEEIGRRLGRSAQAVNHRGWNLKVPLACRRKQRGQQRLEEIQALVNQGITTPEIARHMGLPLTTVRGRIQGMGIRNQADGRSCKPRRAIAPRKPKRKIERISASALAYCRQCSAPVVNTPQGWAGHRERVHGGKLPK